LGNSLKRPRHEGKSRGHIKGIEKNLQQKLEDAYEIPEMILEGDQSKSALNPQTSCFHTSNEKKESNAKKDSPQAKAKSKRLELAGVLSQGSANFKGKSLSSFQNDGVEIRLYVSKSTARSPKGSSQLDARARLSDLESSNSIVVNSSIEGNNTRNTLNVDKSMKKTNLLSLPDQESKRYSRKGTYLSCKTTGTEHQKDLTSGTENSLGALGEVESKQVHQHQSYATDDIESLPTLHSKAQPRKRSILLHLPNDLRTLAADKNWHGSIKKNTSEIKSIMQSQNKNRQL
jgi:uncharacterized lipoprotein NlpE involved in copper resistance